MSKINIPVAQWYISHTCNLSCKNCLSYNNFNISGHERWADNADDVARWGELVTVEDFSIIGGEPLGNPDLHLWVKGLHKYFDTENFKICTNGVQLDRWVDHIAEWTAMGVILEIHTKDKSHLSDTWKFLNHAFAKDIQWRKGVEYDWIGTYNGKTVCYQTMDKSFLTWGTKGRNEQGEYELFETNPKHTHNLCQWSNCHYFFRGGLWKCGTIVGAQEFVKKYPVRQDHKDAILEYKPITITDNLEQDIENLRYMIPQCGLCNNILKTKNRLDSTAKKEKETGFFSSPITTN